MSTSGRELLESFDHLPESEKREIASEIMRRTFSFDRDVQIDEAELAALYAQFADEESRLAEDGVEDYQRGLVGEDAR